FVWVLVPEADHRVGAVMFVPRRTEAGRAEEEVPARPRLEPEPARSEYAEEVPAREQQHVAIDGADSAYHTVGPRSDLVRRLPSRAAVAEQLPVRALGVDLRAGTTFIGAVVPFHEVGIDFRHRAEASELARSNHPLQGAGEHRGELRSLEPLSEPGGFGFTFRRQREIGQSRVLVRDGPGRLPVPG